MSFHASQKDRLGKTVRNALEGCSYESSEAGDGSLFTVTARRRDGRRVQVRFLGVRSTTAEPAPTPGGGIRVVAVGAPFSLRRVLFAPLRSVELGPWHVRIKAGEGQIEVVCQDAEWFEEDRPGS